MDNEANYTVKYNFIKHAGAYLILLIFVVILTGCSWIAESDDSSDGPGVPDGASGYIDIVGADSLVIGTAGGSVTSSETSDEPEIRRLYRVNSDGSMEIVDIQGEDVLSTTTTSILEVIPIDDRWVAMIYAVDYYNNYYADYVIIADRETGGYYLIPDTGVWINGDSFGLVMDGKFYFRGSAEYDLLPENTAVFELDPSGSLTAVQVSLSSDMIGNQGYNLPDFVVNRNGTIVYRAYYNESLSSSRLRIIDANGQVYPPPDPEPGSYFLAPDGEAYFLFYDSGDTAMEITELSRLVIDGGAVSFVPYVEFSAVWWDGNMYRIGDSIVGVSESQAVELYREDYVPGSGALLNATNTTGSGNISPGYEPIRLSTSLVWFASDELLVFDYEEFVYRTIAIPSAYEFSSIYQLAEGIGFSGLRYSDGATVSGLFDIDTGEISIFDESADEVRVIELIPLN